jgi:hypothetical protein
MNPPHEYQQKMSTNSLILAMVAARRNYAGHDCADQIKKAGFPASTIVAQSVAREVAPGGSGARN